MAQRITNRTGPVAAAMPIAVGLAVLTQAGCGITGAFTALIGLGEGGGGGTAQELCDKAIGDCVDPTGACCVIGNCSLDVTESDCHAMSGAYKGDDSSCGEGNCDPLVAGACCEPGGACFIAPQLECGPGNTFMGNGTTCSSDPCG